MTLNDSMHERFSCRNYSDYIPSADEIAELVEAARIAPSACNRQPWHFTVVTPADSTGRSAVLAAYDREWIATANTFIIVSGVPERAWVRPADGHSHLDIDVAIATEHICLRATDLGLATCWICNFDPAALAARLGMPDTLRPMVILPVGRPAEGSSVPEKQRRPINELMTVR